jgi:hypothetical protein
MSRKWTKAELLKGLNIDPKRAKKIGNNTLEYTNDKDERVIRHFQTDVLTFHADGSITLNSGGWRTVTTKLRLNTYQDLVVISQDQRVWYVVSCPVYYTDKDGKEFRSPDWSTKPTHIFADGMRVYPDGRIVGAGVKPDKKLVRKLRKYSKDFAAALPIKPPDGGCCFFCGMTVQGTETSLGDKQKDKEHLLSHVEEGYFVPSLLHRAMKEAGVTNLWMAAAFGQADFFLRPNDKWQQQQYAKWVFNYMYRRVIDGNFETTKPSEGAAA